MAAALPATSSRGPSGPRTTCNSSSAPAAVLGAIITASPAALWRRILAVAASISTPPATVLPAPPSTAAPAGRPPRRRRPAALVGPELALEHCLWHPSSGRILATGRPGAGRDRRQQADLYRARQCDLEPGRVHRYRS